MTKLTIATLALIAAAAFSAQAFAAGNNAAMRRAHAQATTTVGSKSTDCVRAPNVGSFATAPFTEPPCMPGTMR
ncbi:MULTISPECIES: hypothetical protein [unclassified Bradyrhizobium]|uniref:hypothetical protein n=1 Tax=unclassified Bradyrhizobium TaxID=2631580 RepID=UPI00041BC095|nr:MULTISPECIES: hypothetical protein [unclassified Bradyrhizobium]QIG93354.1 hypothetical protein G6P99_13150 [Bradyrhizobium sp. 6(2017)]